jgi:hypothetical protein
LFNPNFNYSFNQTYILPNQSQLKVLFIKQFFFKVQPQKLPQYQTHVRRLKFNTIWRIYQSMFCVLSLDLVFQILIKVIGSLIFNFNSYINGFLMNLRMDLCLLWLFVCMFVTCMDCELIGVWLKFQMDSIGVN